jgi:hypothetical protein
MPGEETGGTNREQNEFTVPPPDEFGVSRRSADIAPNYLINSDSMLPNVTEYYLPTMAPSRVANHPYPLTPELFTDQNGTVTPQAPVTSRPKSDPAQQRPAGCHAHVCVSRIALDCMARLYRDNATCGRGAPPRPELL